MIFFIDTFTEISETTRLIDLKFTYAQYCEFVNYIENHNVPDFRSKIHTGLNFNS